MFSPVTAEELSKSSIFDGLDDAAMESIAERSLKLYAREGITLMNEGETGFKFCVILAGTADVRVGDETVASIGEGDVVGEMSIVSGAKRNADVVATSQLTLATMMGWDYRDISQEYPSVAQALSNLAAERSGS